MPIRDDEWASIQELVRSMLSKKGEYFTMGKVIKRDQKRKLVWLKEFGARAIPCVAFDQEGFVYEQTPNGVNTTAVGSAAGYTTRKAAVKMEISVPKVGDDVLVARMFGSRGLPFCLGKVNGLKYIHTTGD